MGSDPFCPQCCSIPRDSESSSGLNFPATGTPLARRTRNVLDRASVFGSEPVAQSRTGCDASAHDRAGDREQRRPCRFRERVGDARRPNRASRQGRVDICQGCPGRLRTGFLRRVLVGAGLFGRVCHDGGGTREAGRRCGQWSRLGQVGRGDHIIGLANLFQLPLQDGVVISHRLWQDEFGGRTDIRGERVRIDDTPYRIGGVAPEWLDAIYAGSSVDIWAPWSPPSDAAERRGQTLWALGRLHDGVSASRAQALVNTGRETDHLIAVLPYTGLAPEGSAGMSRMRAILPVVALAVFFIACVNVATFLLARSSARSRESSVRMALGASRGQIARQLLADSVVISITGTLLGILLALWTSRIVPALLFDRDAEQLVFRPDLFGTVAASLACATTMIVCGLAPLIEARHDDPARVLRRESAGPSATMQRFRDGLVIAQMTCCCVLIISTAILVSGFRSTFQTSAGRRLQHAILATVAVALRFQPPRSWSSIFPRRGTVRTVDVSDRGDGMVGHAAGQPLGLAAGPHRAAKSADARCDDGCGAVHAAVACAHHASASRRANVRCRRLRRLVSGGGRQPGRARSAREQSGWERHSGSVRTTGRDHRRCRRTPDRNACAPDRGLLPGSERDIGDTDRARTVSRGTTGFIASRRRSHCRVADVLRRDGSRGHQRTNSHHS